MPCLNPDCIRQYDFDHIAFYARKRYVEGVSTIVLMCNAKTESEKTLIVLASMLDLDDENIRQLKPYCSAKCQRLMFDLRDRLKLIIEQECCRQHVI
jgi:ribosomal protein L24E